MPEQEECFTWKASRVVVKWSLTIKKCEHFTLCIFRTQLTSKFTLMKEQWHHVSWVVQQRKKSIDGFLRLWHLFLCCLLSLNRCLVDTKSFVAAVKTQDCHRQRQRRKLIKKLKVLCLFLRTPKFVEFSKVKQLPLSSKGKSSTLTCFADT